MTSPQVPRLLSDAQLTKYRANFEQHQESDYVVASSPSATRVGWRNPLTGSYILRIDELLKVKPSTGTITRWLLELGLVEADLQRVRRIAEAGRGYAPKSGTIEISSHIKYLLQLEKIAEQHLSSIGQLKVKSQKYLYRISDPSFELRRLPLESIPELVVIRSLGSYRIRAGLPIELLSRLRTIIEEKENDEEYIVVRRGFELQRVDYLAHRRSFESRNELDSVIRGIDGAFVRTEETISVYWTVYDQKIDYHLFAGWMLESGEARELIYTDDPEQPQAVSGREVFGYRDRSIIVLSRRPIGVIGKTATDNYLHLRFEINRQESTNLRKDRMLGSSVESEVPRGTNYISISLKAAPSRTFAEGLQLLLSALLIDFGNHQARLLKEYTGAITSFQPKYRSEHRRSNDKETSLDQLKAIAPEVFVDGYGTICQKAHPVYLTFDEAVERWDDTQRPILPYPKHSFEGYKEGPVTKANYQEYDYRAQYQQHVIEPRRRDRAAPYHFVCEDPLYSFIGVRPNKLDNKEEFEYLPCCVKKVQFDAESRSYYNWYYNGMEMQPTKADYVATTEKKMIDGKSSLMFPSVLQLFSVKTILEPGELVHRVGVIKSVNSLLHTLLYVERGASYLVTLSKLSDPEQPARELRSDIANDERLLLAMRQELYDHTLEEIVEQLRGEEYLDSRLYYRGFEEYFGWNLYFFIVPRNGNEGGLEVPVARKGSIRHHRPDRPTLLLIKHWGKSSDPDSEPHYEVVVRVGAQGTVARNERRYSFDDDPFYSIYLQNNQSWSLPGGEGRYYQDLYSLHQVLPLLLERGGIEGQYLDAYGHCRGYLMVVNGEKLSVLCLPQQPQRLPEVKELHRAPLPLVLQLFAARGNTLTRTSRRRATILTGVWFQIGGHPLGLYIPIIEPTPSTDLEQQLVRDLLRLPITANPYQPEFESNSLVERYDSAESGLRSFLFLITWLYRSALEHGLTESKRREGKYQSLPRASSPSSKTMW